MWGLGIGTMEILFGIVFHQVATVHWNVDQDGNVEVECFSIGWLIQLVSVRLMHLSWDHVLEV